MESPDAIERVIEKIAGRPLSAMDAVEARNARKEISRYPPEGIRQQRALCG
jgi:hypothetical protein